MARRGEGGLKARGGGGKEYGWERREKDQLALGWGFGRNKASQKDRQTSSAGQGQEVSLLKLSPSRSRSTFLPMLTHKISYTLQH